MPVRVNSSRSSKGDFGYCTECPARSNFDWQWDLKEKAGHCCISLDPWTGHIQSHDRHWCKTSATEDDYRKFEPKKKRITIYLDSENLEPTSSKMSHEGSLCSNRELTTIYVNQLPLGFKSKLQGTLTNKPPCVYVRRPSVQQDLVEEKNDIVDGQ